jgi:hypothetical protein
VAGKVGYSGVFFSGDPLILAEELPQLASGNWRFMVLVPVEPWRGLGTISEEANVYCLRLFDRV